MKYCVFLFLALLASCRTVPPIASTLRDSVRVEYRESVTLIPDTVFVEIPAQAAERTTRDSVSFLENDFAYSTARISPDGLLFHDLKTKQKKHGVVRPKETIYVTRERMHARAANKARKEYVERTFTRWERFRLEWFTRLCLLCLVLLAFSFRSRLVRLLRVLIGIP